MISTTAVERDEHERQHRRRESSTSGPPIAQQPQQRRDQHRAGRDRLEQQVEDHVDAPRLAVRDVVVDARIAGRFGVRHRRAERPQVDLAFLVIQRTDAPLPAGSRSPRRRDRRPSGPVPFSGLRTMNASRCTICATSLVGSSRSPKIRHSVGQTLTHAGSSLFSTRFAQKLHFSAVCVFGSMNSWSYGHASMQARQPMHDVAVQIDDAVAALEERVGRADAHARRVLALVAEHGEEEPPRVGERALLDRLHPAAVHADRNLVLGLAGDRARVTADALAQVDGEPVVGHEADDYTVPINASIDAVAQSVRRRAETCSSTCANWLGVEPVEPRGRGLELRQAARHRPDPRPAARASAAIVGELRRRPRRPGQRQPLDDRDGHVRRDAQPHQVVGDEAVEHPAEKLLDVVVERRLQAEERVGRDRPGREDRRDQRQAVGGRRDVAVGEPRLARRVVRPRRRPASAGVDVMTATGRRRPRTAGCACLRSPAARRPARLKWARSSVAFSSRPKRRSQPARSPAGRKAEARCWPTIRRRAGVRKLGDRELLAADSRSISSARHAHRIGILAGVRQLVELGRAIGCPQRSGKT